MDDMDFSDMLASSIHDIKNSLGLILNNLSDLLGDPGNQIADMRKASLLQHEVQRANSNLIQLLTLYKLGREQLTIQISENNLREFLDEVLADNQAVCNAMGIEFTTQCDERLHGYFDWELVRSIIGSTVGNAQRYAKSRIEVSATNEDAYLVIRIEDDGDGYPEELLQRVPVAESMKESASHAGRTQLGLTFAHKVSRLHRAGTRIGRIHLRNACHLPGACFELWLP